MIEVQSAIRGGLNHGWRHLVEVSFAVVGGHMLLGNDSFLEQALHVSS